MFFYNCLVYRVLAKHVLDEACKARQCGYGAAYFEQRVLLVEALVLQNGRCPAISLRSNVGKGRVDLDDLIRKQISPSLTGLGFLAPPMQSLPIKMREGPYLAWPGIAIH